MTDAEFDKLHGGRELCPIEQLAYEKEGAENFRRAHRVPPSLARQTEQEIEQWVAKLNAIAREIDAGFQSTHPAVAFKQMAEQTAKFKKIAAGVSTLAAQLKAKP